MDLKKIADKKRREILENKNTSIQDNRDDLRASNDINDTEGEDEKKGSLKPLYDDLVNNDKVITQRGELVYLAEGLWITPDGDIVDLGR